MKIRNILFIIFCSFLCCGCDATYTINLDSKYNVKENIIVTGTSDYDKEEFSKFSWDIPLAKSDFKVSDSKEKDTLYYKLKKENNGISLNNGFSRNGYLQSTIANSAYEYVSIVDVGNETIISTGSNFLLFDMYSNLDNVTIIIKSSKKLVETNADKVENHKYFWYLTKDNAINHDIYLKLNNKGDDRTFLEKILDDEYSNVFVFTGLVCIIGIFIFIFIKINGKYKNRI